MLALAMGGVSCGIKKVSCEDRSPPSAPARSRNECFLYLVFSSPPDETKFHMFDLKAASDVHILIDLQIIGVRP
jgi:hypothetical protein